MKKSAIKVRGMSFKYEDGLAFDNFDIDIYSGTITCIVGKNSSGKTTLAKILGGIYKSDGYININGYLLNNYFISKIRRDFSLCYGENSIMFDTIKDSLSFSLESLQYTKKEMDTLINKISKQLDFQKYLDKTFEEISSSQKQKVIIASALIHKPKIILLDNSLNELNNNDRKSIKKLLKEYQKNYNLTVIIMTNNLEDTLFSDRIIVLDKGKIIKDGNKDDIYSDDFLEKRGFELPFIVKLSQNLMLYDLLDKVYFKKEEVIDKLWN